MSPLPTELKSRLVNVVVKTTTLSICDLVGRPGRTTCRTSCVDFRSHLRRDDVEQVSGRSELLGEDVVVVGLEGDAVHVDDEGAGRQVQGDAVLAQEALELRRLLPQKLQGHLRAWGETTQRSRGVSSRSLCLFLHYEGVW